MASTRESKKRPRSEDCEECIPISKRINRLQIESMPSCTRNPVQAETDVVNGPSKPEDLHLRNLRIRSNSYEINPPTDVNPAVSINNNITTESPNCMACTMGQGDPYYQELMEGYNPELNEQENPYYFNANRLLFDAHVSRAGRHKTDFSGS